MIEEYAMKSVGLVVRFSMAVVAAAAMVWAADNKQEKPLKDVFEQLLPGMSAEKGFEGPQQQWQELCFKAGPRQRGRRPRRAG